uniref:Ovule protein n=1 Tax=Heterorhabditis bacteriophora TaxID=37862 RepID=A0A1I7X4I6_HETBA
MINNSMNIILVPAMQETSCCRAERHIPTNNRIMWTSKMYEEEPPTNTQLVMIFLGKSKFDSIIHHSDNLNFFSLMGF